MITNNTYRKVAIKASGRGIRNASEYKKGFLHCHEGNMYLLSHISQVDRMRDDILQ